MQVKQIYQIVNGMAGQYLGATDLVSEDLSNIVDIGKQLMDSTDTNKLLGTGVDIVGRMVFVDRQYKGHAPSVLRDGWEYGSILEKWRTEIPEAKENNAWKLDSLSTVDPFEINKPKVASKLFNSKVTYQIPMTIFDNQLNMSFQSMTQLNSFWSMVYSAIENGITINTDNLIMATIDSFIGATLTTLTLTDAERGNYTSPKAVNLLKLYNEEVAPAEKLTVAKALTDKEFLRYASSIMGEYINRLSSESKLFNISGTQKFTPKDKLHFVLLDRFYKRLDSYLQSDTFHNEFTSLPNHEIVPFWQGSGTDYSFDKISGIHVNTPENNEVVQTGILGVMFDHDALGVLNEQRTTTTQYNARGRYTNMFYNWESSHFNDLDENFVVFFIQDPSV